MSLQQETRPYVSGFPSGCSDQSILRVTVITKVETNNDVSGA
jgi:hypothetical protein